MRKSLIAGLALALATASPAFAKGHGHHHNGGGDGAFSNGTLQGTYIFEAGGFDNNDTSKTDDGEVGVLGVLTFDGNGGITGNLTLTGADSAAEQASCTAAISTATYNIPNTNTAPGLGTLALVLDNSGTGSSGNPTYNAGTVNFQMVVPSPNGKSAQLLESDSTFPSQVQICGQTINSMVLKGHLKRVEGEGHDD